MGTSGFMNYPAIKRMEILIHVTTMISLEDECQIKK